MHRTADANVNALMPVVYEELRRLASKYLRRRAGPAQVSPTSIVHEAFAKLCAGSTWRDREHFCAVAATAMRQILVDRVRSQKAAKRGGDWERVSLSAVLKDLPSLIDLGALDEALEALGHLDPRQARIVELRFFGGLTAPQVAAHLEVSTSTVEKEWRRARAWLGARLREGN